MGYQRLLVRQWSRRDWLTIAIIAVSTAFLVGTTLLLLTAGAHIATVSGDLATSTSATYHDSIAGAENTAGDDALIFPVAIVQDESGTEHTLLGVPPDAPDEISDATTSWQAATIPPPSDQTISGPVSEEQTVQFEGQQGTTTAIVTPQQQDSIFPPWWYTTSSSTVEELGSTGAVVIETGAAPLGDEGSLLNSDQSDSSVPLISALAFLLTGMNEVLQILTVATAAGAVIIMVVLYSVTRISVREHLETIEVIRSTGGTPGKVLRIFGLRSTLLVSVGVFSGFLLGIFITNLSVVLAGWVGISVTLDPQVTWSVLRVLAPMLAMLVIVGALAGVLAARPAVTVSPTVLKVHAVRRPNPAIIQRFEGYVPSSFTPTLLNWRTFIPTGATLTVFVLLVLLIGGFSTAVAPLGATETGTITSAGAAHPIDSRLDAETADTLQAEGIEASPEIILAQVNNDRPYLARGANYSDFASVTDAELIDGREPTAPDEAVIGRNLAETQDVSIGETRTLGGSDRPGIARVTIVGIYETNSLTDNQLIVPLETGHQLSLDPGTVHTIRTAENVGDIFDTADGSETTSETQMVQGISTPEEAVRGESIPITVYLQNDESTTVTETIEINVDQQIIEREVTLDANEETQIEVDHTFESTGSQTVTTQGHSQTVTVFAPDTLVIPETLPERAPPGATLLVPVATQAGEPVSDGTVAVNGNETTSTANGIARVDLPESEGEYELTARTTGQNEVSHQIQVIDDQQHLLGASLEITPRTGTPGTTPETTVTLTNHWEDEQTQTVRVASPIDEQTQTVTLAPGESRSTDQALGGADSDQQMPPGAHEITVTADDERIATETYEVIDGDFDLDSLPDEAQYQPGAAMGQVIENTVGNIQTLLATMVLLAGLMTVGSTTAAFAQAVHARRKAISIHRSIGARPSQLLGVIVLDACKLAIPAALLAAVGAFVSLYLLDVLGLLSVFGVRLTTDLSPMLILLAMVGAVGIAICSAAFAVIPSLRSSPSTVWHGRTNNRYQTESVGDEKAEE